MLSHGRVAPSWPCCPLMDVLPPHDIDSVLFPSWVCCPLMGVLPPHGCVAPSCMCMDVLPRPGCVAPSIMPWLRSSIVAKLRTLTSRKRRGRGARGTSLRRQTVSWPTHGEHNYLEGKGRRGGTWPVCGNLTNSMWGQSPDICSTFIIATRFRHDLDIVLTSARHRHSIFLFLRKPSSRLWLV